jgi:hypothetical protein
MIAREGVLLPIDAWRLGIVASVIRSAGPFHRLNSGRWSTGGCRRKIDLAQGLYYIIGKNNLCAVLIKSCEMSINF